MEPNVQVIGTTWGSASGIAHDGNRKIYAQRSRIRAHTCNLNWRHQGGTSTYPDANPTAQGNQHPSTALCRLKGGARLVSAPPLGYLSVCTLGKRTSLRHSWEPMVHGPLGRHNTRTLGNIYTSPHEVPTPHTPTRRQRIAIAYKQC